ncbi:MAG: NAD(P)/FAD-dependent oxidoreductase [Gaiellaceae bacterium]
MDVVVVGGGAAGLATAAMLKRRGLEPVVLERGDEVGTSWRRRYDRLQLHTVRWLSGLPGHRIPRRYGKWPSRDRVCDYLRDYADRHGLDVRFGVEAQRVVRTSGGWRVETSAGAFEAPHVVVATGYNGRPVLPDWPGREEWPGTLVHASEYRNPEPFRGCDVLVVGAGNSAAEIAVDLLEGGAAQVRLSVRTPPHIVRRDTLGLPSQVLGILLTKLPRPWINPIALFLRRRTIPDLAPFGLPIPPEPPGMTFVRKWMIPILDVGIVDAVRSGRVRVVAALERFEDGEVVLADGSRLRPDAVVAGTGYRPALEPLVGDLGVLDERGRPTAATPLPGLHFVGFTVTLGGLLRGIGIEARTLADNLA